LLPGRRGGQHQSLRSELISTPLTAVLRTPSCGHAPSVIGEGTGATRDACSRRIHLCVSFTFQLDKVRMAMDVAKSCRWSPGAPDRAARPLGGAQHRCEWRALEALGDSLAVNFHRRWANPTPDDGGWRRHSGAHGAVDPGTRPRESVLERVRLSLSDAQAPPPAFLAEVTTVSCRTPDRTIVFYAAGRPGGPTCGGVGGGTTRSAGLA
jgi:hypothetical protein